MSAYGLSLGRLNLHLSTDTSRLSTGFMTFRNEMRKTKTATRGLSGGISTMTGKLTEFRDSMMSVGRRLSLTVSVPLAIIGAQALKTAGEFQLGMNRVKALTGATGAAFNALTQQALMLGRTTQFSASQASQAMGFLAMAGQRTSQILGSVPAVLQLAASALIDMGKSADIVTNIMAGFGISVKNLPGAVDILVKAFTSANTNLVQLGHAMKYVGPVAKAVGFDFKEVVAAVALLGNAGIQASLAGTSLRGAILRITKPTGEAAEALKALGINVKTSDGRLKGLIDILEEFEIAIKRAGGETKVAGEIMQILGLRAGPGILALLSQGSKKVRELANEFNNVGGYAKKVADVQLQGYAGALRRIISTTEGVGIAIGEVMIPAFENISSSIVKMNNYVIGLGPAARYLIVAFLGFTAVVGPLALVTALLFSLLSPMVLLTAAAVVFGAAAMIVWYNWEELGPMFGNLFKGIRDEISKNPQYAMYDFLLDVSSLRFDEAYESLKRFLEYENENPRTHRALGQSLSLGTSLLYIWRKLSGQKPPEWKFLGIPEATTSAVKGLKIFIDNMSFDVATTSWDNFKKAARGAIAEVEKLTGSKFEIKFLGIPAAIEGLNLFKDNMSFAVVEKALENLGLKWDAFVAKIKAIKKILTDLNPFSGLSGSEDVTIGGTFSIKNIHDTWKGLLGTVKETKTAVTEAQNTLNDLKTPSIFADIKQSFKNAVEELSNLSFDDVSFTNMATGLLGNINKSLAEAQKTGQFGLFKDISEKANTDFKQKAPATVKSGLDEIETSFSDLSTSLVGQSIWTDMWEKIVGVSTDQSNNNFKVITDGLDKLEKRFQKLGDNIEQSLRESLIDNPIWGELADKISKMDLGPSQAYAGFDFSNTGKMFEDVAKEAQDGMKLWADGQKDVETQIHTTIKAMDEQKKRLVEFQEMMKTSGMDFITTSHQRTPQHNKEVGGSERSSHLGGFAMDFKVNLPGKTPEEVMADVRKIEEFARQFDMTAIWKQYVNEKTGLPSHVHVQIKAGVNQIKETLTEMHHETTETMSKMRDEIVGKGGEAYAGLKEWFNKMKELWKPYEDAIHNQSKQPQELAKSASGGMRGMLTALKKEAESLKATQVKFSMGDPYRNRMGQDIAQWESPKVDSKVLNKEGKPRGVEFQALRDLITNNVGEGLQEAFLNLVDAGESAFGQGLAKNFPEFKATVDKMVAYAKQQFDPHDVQNILGIFRDQMAQIDAQEMVTPFLGIEGRKDLSFAEKRFKATADAATKFQYELNQLEGTDLKGTLADLKSQELPDLGQITIIEQELTRLNLLQSSLGLAKAGLKELSDQLKVERGIKEFDDMGRGLKESIASTKALEKFTNEFGLAGERVYDGLNERVRIYREALIGFESLKEAGKLDILPTMTDEQKEKVNESLAKIDELKVKMAELQNEFNVGFVFDMLANSVTNSMNQMVTGVLRGTRDVGSLMRDMIQNIIISFTSDALQQAVGILLGMLKKIILQAQLTKLVLSFIGIGAGGGGGGGAFPGGQTGSQVIGGVLGRAGGGRTQRNRPYMVGEEGKSELFVPDTSGTVIPQSRLRGGSMSGGSSNLVVNVHNYGDKEVKVERKQTGSNQQEQLDVFVGQAVARDIRRGGDVSRAIQDTYHFKRAGGGRG